MVLVFRFGLVLIALLVVWMSPGVYLVGHGIETEVIHFHYSETHADSEHTHEYLAHFFQKIVVEVGPLLLVSVQVWIALHAFSGLWQWIDADFLHGGKWEPILLLPPPKAAIKLDEAAFHLNIWGAMPSEDVPILHFATRKPCDVSLFIRHHRDALQSLGMTCSLYC